MQDRCKKHTGQVYYRLKNQVNEEWGRVLFLPISSQSQLPANKLTSLGLLPNESHGTFHYFATFQNNLIYAAFTQIQ